MRGTWWNYQNICGEKKSHYWEHPENSSPSRDVWTLGLTAGGHLLSPNNKASDHLLSLEKKKEKKNETKQEEGRGFIIPGLYVWRLIFLDSSPSKLSSHDDGNMLEIKGNDPGYEGHFPDDPRRSLVATKFWLFYPRHHLYHIHVNICDTGWS